MMKSSEKALERYARSGCKSVEGWLYEGAVTLTVIVNEIQRKFGIQGHIGEIGIHHGKLFILLYLMLRSDEYALAVDVFDDIESNVDASGRGNKNIFLKNLKHHAGDDSRLKIIQQDSTKLGYKDIQDTVNGKYRLFSIDGGHTAYATYHDLITVSQSLSEGGVVILDDYFNEKWPGVSVGINKFILEKNNVNLTPFLIGGNKLFITTSKEYSERYLDELNQYRIGKDQKLSMMYDSRVICFGFTRLSFKERLEMTRFWKKIRTTRMGRWIKKVIRGYS